ncbi:hypothetical protein B0A52_08961 [Exophiala mesophila]|uniref:Major facilitator superfamily (MFS) profile domain-containing protein n=1 Tax=Exophiala mesophila TaxID=212818 RepID=A0A438MSV7_EXOME|nr:hypothetical protein B0A52_08961 [Exophiala mesophila]
MAKLTPYNVGIGVIVAIGTFGYGYGFGVFITSIGQPGFYLDMKLDPTSRYTANILGAINALFAAGAAFGAISQAWLADRFGRKKSLAMSALLSCIGAAWTAGSPYISMLLTIRVVHGFGLGMLICLVPLYLTEVSPPHCRGIISGMTVMGFGVGYCVVAFVSVGTYYSTNPTLQWRLPLALAAVGPLGLLLGLPFVPESPRYLCWVGQAEAALKVIERLHNDQSDPNNAAAYAEFVQIKAQVEIDKEQKSGYITMFTKPSWRRRSLLVVFIMFSSQATGVNGIANYLVVIFADLGLTGILPLLLYGIYAVVGTAAAIYACFVMDRFGRRQLFIIGFPVLAVNLIIEALLQREYLNRGNKAAGGAAVAFIFLFIVLYQFIDAPSFVWCAEIFPTNLRAKGIGLSMFAYFVGFITFSTPGPRAFREIKWGMYLIYMGCSIVCGVIAFFYVPETKGLPIEEMGVLFNDGVALHMTSDGRGIVEKQENQEIERVEVESKLKDEST